MTAPHPISGSTSHRGPDPPDRHPAPRSAIRHDAEGDRRQGWCRDLVVRFAGPERSRGASRRAVGVSPLRWWVATTLAGLCWIGPKAVVEASPPASPRAEASRQRSKNPLEASWFDRTRDRTSAGWTVRSDLDAISTKEILTEIDRLGRVFATRLGDSGGRRRLWCFSRRRDAEDTVRVRLGDRLDPERHASFVVDPVAGREGVFVVRPRRGDVAVWRDEIAAAVAAAAMSRRPQCPPWLAHGIVEWFRWATSDASLEGVRPPPGVRRDLRDAWREGRRLGADRLTRLDDRGWAANEALGSGPLQRAEAGVLVASLLADPATRPGVLGMLATPRTPGASPDETFRATWPGLSRGELDEAMDRLVAPEATPLEHGLLELSWLADGRASLESDPPTAPAALRKRLLETEFPGSVPCLTEEGRCSTSPPEAIVAWEEFGDDRWVGRVGPWSLTLEWRTASDGRRLGVPSVARRSE